MDLTPMRRQEGWLRVRLAEIPDAHRSILAGAREALTVGREGQREDRVLILHPMFQWHAAGCAEIPYPYRSVLAGRRRASTTGAGRNRQDARRLRVQDLRIVWFVEIPHENRSIEAPGNEVAAVDSERDGRHGVGVFGEHERLDRGLIEVPNEYFPVNSSRGDVVTVRSEGHGRGDALLAT